MPPDRTSPLWTPDAGPLSAVPGAAVVEQNQMELFGTIPRRDARPERVIRVHTLAGRGAGQELEENFEVGEGGDDLLDAGEDDVHAREGLREVWQQGRLEATLAFTTALLEERFRPDERIPALAEQLAEIDHSARVRRISSAATIGDLEAT